MDKELLETARAAMQALMPCIYDVADDNGVEQLPPEGPLRAHLVAKYAWLYAEALHAEYVPRKK